MGPRHNLFLYIWLTYKVTIKKKKTRLQCCSILMQSNIHFQQSPQYYIKFFSSCFGIVETVTTMPFFFFYTSSLFKKGSSGDQIRHLSLSLYSCLFIWDNQTNVDSGTDQEPSVYINMDTFSMYIEAAPELDSNPGPEDCQVRTLTTQ